jgi:hypothetical protein
MNDRTGNALGLRNLKINGKEEPIKLNIGDVRDYLKTTSKLKKDDDEAGFVDFQMDFAIKLLKQGQPDRDAEELAYLVEFNANDVFMNLPVALNLASEKDMKAVKVKEDSKN